MSFFQLGLLTDGDGYQWGYTTTPNERTHRKRTNKGTNKQISYRNGKKKEGTESHKLAQGAPPYCPEERWMDGWGRIISPLPHVDRLIPLDYMSYFLSPSPFISISQGSAPTPRYTNEWDIGLTCCYLPLVSYRAHSPSSRLIEGYAIRQRSDETSRWTLE